jgi:DNA-binding NtrC family response regulator
MLELFENLRKAGASNSTVILRGESGTGKELIARAIHDLSARREEPFLPVDCGALAETLLESEIFGHVKGAFSGAVSDRLGLAQAVRRGTLFLDEVSETTNAFQLKLLRLVQNREFKPVGSSTFRKTSARFIAASHQDLESLVREKSFRKDLYYRLSVVTIHVPPLRERTGDVPLLADHFLGTYALGDEKPKPVLSRGALKVLARHSWPGNVRELENVCEALVAMCGKSRIEAGDVEERLTLSATLDSSKRHPARSKRGRSDEEVTRALAETGGNVKEAGELLGVSRQHMYKLRGRKST